MFAHTVSTAEPKNIKEAMANSAWIEAMQEELHQFNRLQRKYKSRRKYKKAIKVPYTEPQAEERVPTPSNDPIPSAEIKKLQKRVKKLEGKKKKITHALKRLYKVGLSFRIVSSDEKGLGDQEDASKRERIAEIDADEDLSLINETA
nr:hypothetical protein [Tanacetum cinerariifolium]